MSALVGVVVMETRTCKCGCGSTFEVQVLPKQFPWGLCNRRFLNRQHRARFQSRLNARKKVKRRFESIGRRCDNCGRTDAQVTWSNNRHRCCSCERRRSRRGDCDECGAILYFNGCRRCLQGREPTVDRQFLRAWHARRTRPNLDAVRARIFGRTT